MTPVSLEHHILAYLERANGCAATLVLPPPAACSGQVHGAYAFLQHHPLSWFFVLLFGLVIVRMTMAAWKQS